MTNFWTNKRVCVLGGAGFLGSHVVELLLSQDAIVEVIDDNSRGQNIIDGAEYNRTEVTALVDFGIVIKRFSPDVVLNLAASVAGVLYNQTHNAEMYANNMALQAVPVQVCAGLKVPRFIQISSVCVYAPEYAAGALEANGQLGEPVAANNGYSWAKRMGERVALWSDLPSVSIVRPSNMYGPRDYFDERAHVIPALIKKCLHDDVIKVHGTGDEVREFLYVEDAARGLLAVAEHGAHREVYNLGTNGDTAIPVSCIVQLIQRATSTTHKQVEFTGGDAGDITRWSDCNKARFDLGFKFSHLIEGGLPKTIEWYQHEVVPA